MQNAQGGVKTKVYGKKGRRQRAAERLQARITLKESVLEGYNKYLNACEKQKKLNPIEKEEYERCLFAVDEISASIPRMQKELTTLKNRI